MKFAAIFGVLLIASLAMAEIRAELRINPFNPLTPLSIENPFGQRFQRQCPGPNHGGQQQCVPQFVPLCDQFQQQQPQRRIGPCICAGGLPRLLLPTLRQNLCSAVCGCQTQTDPKPFWTL